MAVKKTTISPHRPKGAVEILSFTILGTQSLRAVIAAAAAAAASAAPTGPVGRRAACTTSPPGLAPTPRSPRPSHPRCAKAPTSTSTRP